MSTLTNKSLVMTEEEKQEQPISKALESILIAKKERDDIERQMPELMKRKAEAEDKIRKLTRERLLEAEQIGDVAAEKALFTTMIVGGVGGAVTLSNKTRLSVLQPQPHVLVLATGSYAMAVRASNSRFDGLYLLGTGGNLNDWDRSMLSRFEAVLKTWMQPYAWVPVEAVRIIATNYV